MAKFFKRSAVLFLILALVAVPCSAMATSEMGALDDQILTAAMVTDVVLVRPLSLASTVIGFGFFVVSAPFSALGGNIGEAWNIMVTKPAKFTFARPLGDFN